MLKDNLRKARKQAGLTQKEVAEKIGVSESAYCGYETGKRSPDALKISKIANVLGATGDFLLGTNGTTVVDFGSFALDSTAEPTKGITIPVLGQVAAGIPITAVEDILDYEEITQEMASQGEHIALRIKGDSMEPKISDGDVVIVRLQEDASTGDIVVALVNGEEATVKRLKKSANGITLIPTNPCYEPIYFTNEEIEQLPVRIIGKVVELRAKF